jgi:uncharacterized protein YqeY
MKTALKAGEKERLSALRMLLSELKNARIAAGEDLTREAEEKVLSSYAKKRKEAIEKYREGGRPELADKEEREYQITVSYLPEQLEEPEIREIIDKTITELQAGGMKDFGRVMKAVMGEVGSRAEGSAVSALLKEMING